MAIVKAANVRNDGWHCGKEDIGPKTIDRNDYNKHTRKKRVKGMQRCQSQGKAARVLKESKF